MATQNTETRGNVNNSTYISSSHEYSWNINRSSAIGWDVAKIGFAGAVLLGGPTVPIIATSIAVFAVVHGGLKLALDLGLPDSDQKLVDKNWAIVDPGGRATAFASSLVGNDAESIAKHAKYGALAFSLAGTSVGIAKSRTLEPKVLQSSAKLYDAFQKWNEEDWSSADHRDRSGADSEQSELNSENGAETSYDGIPVDETHFSLEDLIGETNDPSINGESYDFQDDSATDDDDPANYDDY